jgi:hypothetical protein
LREGFVQPISLPHDFCCAYLDENREKENLLKRIEKGEERRRECPRQPKTADAMIVSVTLTANSLVDNSQPCKTLRADVIGWLTGGFVWLVKLVIFSVAR